MSARLYECVSVLEWPVEVNYRSLMECWVFCAVRRRTWPSSIYPFFHLFIFILFGGEEGGNLSANTFQYPCYSFFPVRFVLRFKKKNLISCYYHYLYYYSKDQSGITDRFSERKQYKYPRKVCKKKREKKRIRLCKAVIFFSLSNASLETTHTQPHIKKMREGNSRTWSI